MRTEGVNMMNRTGWPENLYTRQYVPVRVGFSDEGAMLPLAIVWTDGREYPIDRVKHLCSAPALKAGGQGDRYTVEIGNHERCLFFEHNADYGSARIGRWFLEVRKSG